MHTIQCSSAVFRPQNNLKLCFHAGLKAKRQTCACVSTNVLTSKLQLYEMHTMFPLGLFVLFWVVLFFFTYEAIFNQPFFIFSQFFVHIGIFYYWQCGFSLQAMALVVKPQ